MQHRKLGRTGIAVPPIAFGGNVFGWTIDEATSFAARRLVAVGLNFIDTADVYSRWVPGNQGGESETIIGGWLQHAASRSGVTIVTKVGMEMGRDKEGLSRA